MVRFSAISAPALRCAASPRWPLRGLGYNDPSLKVPIRGRMPLETRLNMPFATALDLPPAFRLVTLREVGDAFAHAKANAAELGAGTLVYVGRFDLAEFAVVLEPDEPLRTARRAFYAGMAALADALIAHAPPEKPIALRLARRDLCRSGAGRRRAARLAARPAKTSRRNGWCSAA